MRVESSGIIRFNQFGSLFAVHLYSESWKQRTKHLAPDTDSPVTHHADRPRDREKDGQMENSKKAGEGGSDGGSKRYCRF